MRDPCTATRAPTTRHPHGARERSSRTDGRRPDERRNRRQARPLAKHRTHAPRAHLRKDRNPLTHGGGCMAPYACVTTTAHPHYRCVHDGAKANSAHDPVRPRCGDQSSHSERDRPNLDDRPQRGPSPHLQKR